MFQVRIYLVELSRFLKNFELLNILKKIFLRGGDKFDILRLREQKLRKKIRAAINVKTSECERRQNSQPTKVCVVAVIGYTNAGKTTLIKKLDFFFTVYIKKLNH